MNNGIADTSYIVEVTESCFSKALRLAKNSQSILIDISIPCAWGRGEVAQCRFDCRPCLENLDRSGVIAANQLTDPWSAEPESACNFLIGCSPRVHSRYRASPYFRQSINLVSTLADRVSGKLKQRQRIVNAIEILYVDHGAPLKIRPRSAILVDPLGMGFIWHVQVE